jgi:hypothetical protein
LYGLDEMADAPMRRCGNMMVCAMCTRIKARIDGDTARADSPKCDAGRRCEADPAPAPDEARKLLDDADAVIERPLRGPPLALVLLLLLPNDARDADADNDGRVIDAEAGRPINAPRLASCGACEREPSAEAEAELVSRPRALLLL